MVTNERRHWMPRMVLATISLFALVVSGCGSDTPTGPVDDGQSAMVRRIAINDTLGAIGGVVFDDVSRDGDRDEGEPGLEGLSVGLAGPTGTTWTATTDVDGNYLFDDLEPGFYVLSAPVASGWSNTSALNAQIKVNAAEMAIVDHGLTRDEEPQPGTVGGKVFDDVNGNGMLDEGEAGLEGLTVALIDGSGKSVDTLTDAMGDYEFMDVLPGDYGVQGPVVEGWTNTTPASVAVQVGAGLVAQADFGLKLDEVPTTATVGGTVYEDLDGNGMRDEGERGIAGVMIRLSSRNNPRNEDTNPGYGIHRYAETGEDGTYVFEDVRPGTWRVSVKKAGGYHIATDRRLDYELAAGDHIEDADFGLVTKHGDGCDGDDDDDDGDDD